MRINQAIDFHNPNSKCCLSSWVNNSISSARCPSLGWESGTTLGCPSLCRNAHGFPESETGKGTRAPSDGSLSSLLWFLDMLALCQQPAFTFMAFPDYLSRRECVLSLLQLCLSLSSGPRQSTPRLGQPQYSTLKDAKARHKVEIALHADIYLLAVLFGDLTVSWGCLNKCIKNSWTIRKLFPPMNEYVGIFLMR